ncbi:MAG TPA: tetratricopeptide repeat protein [Rhodocyclaceae bacterium]|nr:tetratricopeptide repeat protein [Rhodocyclaceae bacterium]
MTRNSLCGLALLAAVTLSAGSAFAADPSLQEVYRAAESGQLKQAEAMMDQVLRDHPNSGKAHFVDAEILAKDGQIERARAEFGTAERLAPGLPFAKPEAVASLKARLNPPARLAPTAAVVPMAAPAPASQFPWGLALMGAGLLAAIIFFVRTLRRPAVITGGGNYAPAGGGYGPGGYPQPVGGLGPMGPMAPTGGMGSGILGGLATGAAVGAGMVAGEALMHRVFDGGHGSEAAHVQPPLDYPVTPDANYDMGGNNFGVADGGSWDDGGAGAGGGDDWN